MDWRNVWTSTTGSAPPFTYPPHWVGSLWFYAAVYLFSMFLRSVNHRAIAQGLPRDAVADFISTFQTCAMSMENMHVLHHYGYVGLAVVLFLQIYLFLSTYGNSQCSPTGNFQKWWAGGLSTNHAVIKISLQALAAYASYQYAKLVWNVDLLPDHKNKLTQVTCYTDLHVSILAGFLIEAAATIIDSWMSMQVFMRSEPGDLSLKAAIDTAMIVLGLNLTGMYFNPSMASANTFGCTGINYWEHMLVYWGGPFFGVIIAMQVGHKIKIKVQ